MPLKLGHVAYRVNDVQQVVKFYTDVLGFRVSDWRDDIFAFLRCGPDHHTRQFRVRRGAAAPSHRLRGEGLGGDSARLRVARQERHPARPRPGRHIIGHDIAIYHRNADQVRVEFFCEMDQMKDEALGYFDPRPWHPDTPQRPKVWSNETCLRSYWGFGSDRSDGIRGYQTVGVRGEGRAVAPISGMNAPSCEPDMMQEIITSRLIGARARQIVHATVDRRRATTDKCRYGVGGCRLIAGEYYVRARNYTYSDV